MKYVTILSSKLFNISSSEVLSIYFFEKKKQKLNNWGPFSGKANCLPDSVNTVKHKDVDGFLFTIEGGTSTGGTMGAVDNFVQRYHLHWSIPSWYIRRRPLISKSGGVKFSDSSGGGPLTTPRRQARSDQSTTSKPFKLLVKPVPIVRMICRCLQGEAKYSFSIKETTSHFSNVPGAPIPAFKEQRRNINISQVSVPKCTH